QCGEMSAKLTEGTGCSAVFPDRVWGGAPAGSKDRVLGGSRAKPLHFLSYYVIIKMTAGSVPCGHFFD
ncbi:MAG: hypothetical protein Q4A05_03915, partial [Ruminococcus sp.]|nr:hypothetical protein [Ruminococcus sp.]